jgi:hypothetical protein
MPCKRRLQRLKHDFLPSLFQREKTMGNWPKSGAKIEMKIQILLQVVAMAVRRNGGDSDWTSRSDNEIDDGTDDTPRVELQSKLHCWKRPSGHGALHVPASQVPIAGLW